VSHRLGDARAPRSTPRASAVQRQDVTQNDRPYPLGGMRGGAELGYAPPVTAPGWFPDAQNPSCLRWWDGNVWTAHTRPADGAAVPAANPFMSPAVPVVAPVPPNLQAAVYEAEARLVGLRRELESVEEAIDIQSFGFYRPKYGFQSSDQYAIRLEQVRGQQKHMIKMDTATFCDTPWKVDGSAAEGRKMIQRMSKLMLRAFNGECDAAIAKARYDNVVKLDQRITKSCEEVNKLGHSNRVMITRPYYELKLAELHLVHEHREKVQEEKEEQKRIRDELREQEKARAEIERAQADAEKDEERHEKALVKARAELASAMGAQHDKLEALVTRLETDLKDAIDRKAKAIARAQLTKSGHVYVLSNIGSFGEGIYKIGMTRRLEPLERVDELGSASVPFPFDVHAMIYSEDAPQLENALHKEFSSRRLNRVNLRREYFQVTLDEVRGAIQKHHALVTFVLTPEAEEWRKTRAMLEATP
jgi:hypothetical protein